MAVKSVSRLALAGAVLAALCACQSTDKANTPEARNSGASSWPSIESEVATDPAIEARIADILSQMTLEEKVGQLIQPEIKQVTPDDVRDYHLGSVLNGGGTTPDNNKKGEFCMKFCWQACSTNSSAFCKKLSTTNNGDCSSPS